MVLGFGSKSRKKGKGADSSHVVRMSPSLPEMKSQGIPWPADLVDVAAIRQSPPPDQRQVQGAAKVSFSSPDRSAIPFHRPFRMSPSKSTSAAENSRPSIASIYMSHPPSAYPAAQIRSPTSLSINSKHSTSHRRARVAPTFNLMVAGAQGTGKSSLLRLLIDTADVSPTATSEQRSSMDRFLRDTYRRTEEIDTSCLEISESRFDRILLSVIDTPGLDLEEGHELKLERQVSNIVKYLDLQFADTMGEESKVLRKGKSDQHVHLCIYLIDSETITTNSARKATQAIPLKSRSEVMLPYKYPILTSADGHSAKGRDRDDAASAEQDQDRLTMAPADLRVIRRLANRVNVLPIVARADMLTDEKLAAVKEAIRRDLRDAKIGFGVFAPGMGLNSKGEKEKEPSEDRDRDHDQERDHVENNADTKSEISSPGTGTEATLVSRSSRRSQSDEGFGSGESSSEEDERQSRPKAIIKLNPFRRLTTRSNSRSRRELADVLADKRAPVPLDAADPESVSCVRFSAKHFAAKGNSFEDILPFAVVMPESNARRKPVGKAPQSPVKSGAGGRPISAYSADGFAMLQADNAGVNGNGNHSHMSNGRETPTPTPSLRSPSSEQLPFPHGVAPYIPPRALRGVFVRRFRWGTVDVLDPAHCDFAALRTAVLCTHLKVLKTHTREVLYERYRTEKLLARRATKNIGEEERKRLLEDLGL